MQHKYNIFCIIIHLFISYRYMTEKVIVSTIANYCLSIHLQSQKECIWDSAITISLTFHKALSCHHFNKISSMTKLLSPATMKVVKMTISRAVRNFVKNDYVSISRSLHYQVSTSHDTVYVRYRHDSGHYIMLRLFNTLRPRQIGHDFPDDIFKCIFANENV